MVQVHGFWLCGPLRADTREICTCTLHSPSRPVMGRRETKLKRERAAEGFLRRSSPCVVLMPPVGGHRWRFPGCGCCGQCAAVRLGSRSLPGLQCVPAVPALAVSGARLPRRPCGSVLVLPGSAAGAAVAESRACRPCCHSPSSVPAWPWFCQSWGITSPKRLAGVTSPPFRCSQIRLGTQRYAPGGIPAISRCNKSSYALL